MGKAIIVIVVALLVGMLAGACQRTSTTTPHASPMPSETTEQLPIAPEDMPTAAPRWTAAPTQPPAATPQIAQQAPDIVALVDGVPIGKAEYDAQLAQAQAYLLQQPGLDLDTEAGQAALHRLRQQVLHWLIDQTLIDRAAAARGINISEADIEAEIAQMRGEDEARFENWLAANGLTLDMLRQQLRRDLVTLAIRDAVTPPPPYKAQQVHVRHILLSDEEAAQVALHRIRGGEDFALVAGELSEDYTTRDRGGDLGFLPEGVLPPAVESVVWTLQPGQVSEIVRSEFGFHIVQVVDLDPDRALPEEFWPVVQQRAFDAWLAEERARAEITIYADVG